MTRVELLELLKKARKQLKKYHVPKNEQTVRLSIDTLESALSEEPEIVRCMDCENFVWNSISQNAGSCGIEIGNGRNYWHSKDWFCANGKKREET